MAISPVGSAIHDVAAGMAVWGPAGVTRYAMPRSNAAPDEETFGEMVRKLRDRLPGRVSQARLGEMAGVSEKTIQNIEAGDSTDPSTKTVRGLAAAFGIPVSTLSRKVGWIPVEEADPNWLFAGLSVDDQRRVVDMVKRLKDPPEQAMSPQLRARSSS